MRTIEVNVYKFDELSDAAQREAINNLSDLNVDREWWDCTYEDAKNIGLKIKGFDLDRNRGAEGEFMLSAAEVAQNISTNHGETCSTYKTAEQFMEDWQPLFDRYMDESNEEDYESYDLEQEMIEAETEFLNSLLEDYSIMLQNECDYLCSEEALIESIEVNEYEFDENGNLI